MISAGVASGRSPRSLTLADACAADRPEFRGQYELHFLGRNQAFNLSTTPSMTSPEFAEDSLQLSQTGSLPPQALCQITPAVTTAAQSPTSPHDHGQCKAWSNAQEVEAEQHCHDRGRYTGPGMPRQHDNTNVQNMTHTTRPQRSVCEISNSAEKRICLSAPALFCVQLPSSQSTEQTSQGETSAPEAPLSTAGNAPSGPRQLTRVTTVTVATTSSHDQLGAENRAPWKRVYADGAGNDSGGARTVKRPRLGAIHSSTPASRAAYAIDMRRSETRSPLPVSEDELGNTTVAKPLRQPLHPSLAESPGANKQELVRPQSRQAKRSSAAHLVDKWRSKRRSPLPTSEDELGNMTLTKPLPPFDTERR